MSTATRSESSVYTSLPHSCRARTWRLLDVRQCAGMRTCRQWQRGGEDGGSGVVQHSSAAQRRCRARGGCAADMAHRVEGASPWGRRRRGRAHLHALAAALLGVVGAQVAQRLAVLVHQHGQARGCSGQRAGTGGMGVVRPLGMRCVRQAAQSTMASPQAAAASAPGSWAGAGPLHRRGASPAAAGCLPGTAGQRSGGGAGGGSTPAPLSGAAGAAHLAPWPRRQPSRPPALRAGGRAWAAWPPGAPRLSRQDAWTWLRRCWVLHGTGAACLASRGGGRHCLLVAALRRCWGAGRLSRRSWGDVGRGTPCVASVGRAWGLPDRAGAMS